MAAALRIDVWSDVVCPWCTVGMAHLDRALQEFEHADEVEVILHAFQLNPEAPRRSDVDLTTHLADKYGISPGQARAGQARLVDIGSGLGIDFRFDRAISGNTFDAHRLLALAHTHGRQLDLKRRLWRAYFTDGEPIGEHDTLRRAGIDVGLEPEGIDDVLGSDRFRDEVEADIAQARRLGITGVPFFVFDGQLAVSGAQPPELLRDVLQRRWAEAHPQPVEVPGADDAAACGPDGCPI